MKNNANVRCKQLDAQFVRFNFGTDAHGNPQSRDAKVFLARVEIKQPANHYPPAIMAVGWEVDRLTTGEITQLKDSQVHQVTDRLVQLDLGPVTYQVNVGQ